MTNRISETFFFTSKYWLYLLVNIAFFMSFHFYGVEKWLENCRKLYMAFTWQSKGAVNCKVVDFDKMKTKDLNRVTLETPLSCDKWANKRFFEPHRKLIFFTIASFTYDKRFSTEKIIFYSESFAAIFFPPSIKIQSVKCNLNKLHSTKCIYLWKWNVLVILYSLLLMALSLNIE